MTDTLTPAELREWRERHGLTQAEAGDVLGVAENTVYRWERPEEDDNHMRVRNPKAVRALMRERDHQSTGGAR